MATNPPLARDRAERKYRAQNLVLGNKCKMFETVKFVYFVFQGMNLFLNLTRMKLLLLSAVECRFTFLMVPGKHFYLMSNFCSVFGLL